MRDCIELHERHPHGSPIASGQWEGGKLVRPCCIHDSHGSHTCQSRSHGQSSAQDIVAHDKAPLGKCQTTGSVKAGLNIHTHARAHSPVVSVRRGDLMSRACHALSQFLSPHRITRTSAPAS